MIRRRSPNIDVDDEPIPTPELESAPEWVALIEGLMEREGVNRSELANRLGIAMSGVYKLLSGKHKVSVDRLTAVCEALGYELRLEAGKQ